jgi:glycerol-3-phosphate acyltransferase PlsY
MSSPLREGVLVLVAYALGSLSFATILVRVFRRVDVRTEGSGNAGATNVLRTSGKPLAIATLVLDLAKGSVAVLLMWSATYDFRWLGAAAFAAILGHVFPIFFGFRGGKGVATAVGAFLVMAPLAVLCIAAAFVLVIAATRLVSLGSITAACLLPLSMSVLFRAPEPLVVAAAATAALLVFSHRSNIRRLVAGTERRLGRKDEP